MPNITEYQNELVKAYSPDDPNFHDKIKEINTFFDNLPKSPSKKDPNRLSSRAVFISNLRYRCLDKAGHILIDLKSPAAQLFNRMTPKEQLKFQAQSIEKDINPWVHELDIMPENLQNFVQEKKDSLAHQNLRAKIDGDKLTEDVVSVDGDRLLTKLGQYLTENKRWQELVSALLLMTGRRTIEVLKTAEFYLTDEMDEDEYRCQFRGQCKVGLNPVESFEIPLLAPFSLVHKALQRLRRCLPTTDLTNVEVNQSYAGPLGIFTKKAVGMTPHELRSSYAMITYKLLKGKKMSLIGHIGKILGHASTKSAAYYQRLEINNLSGPYLNEEEEEEDEDEWVAEGAVENKRLADIKEMIARRKKITATSLCNFSKASMAPIHRVLLKNKQKINKYNASLGKDGEQFAKVVDE